MESCSWEGRGGTSVDTLEAASRMRKVWSTLGSRALAAFAGSVVADGKLASATLVAVKSFRVGDCSILGLGCSRRMATGPLPGLVDMKSP